MMESIDTSEEALRGINPRFAKGATAERLSLLYRMYAAAIGDAAARGWQDAAAGLSTGSAECASDQPEKQPNMERR